MCFAAYQSFLFNKILRRLVSKISDKYDIVISVPVDYYFPVRISDKSYNYLKILIFLSSLKRCQLQTDSSPNYTMKYYLKEV